MKEPSFDYNAFEKFPDEIKTEIQKAHLEMVLNRDFKPIYVNETPTSPVHEVKIDTTSYLYCLRARSTE